MLSIFSIGVAGAFFAIINWVDHKISLKKSIPKMNNAQSFIIENSQKPKMENALPPRLPPQENQPTSEPHSNNPRVDAIKVVRIKKFQSQQLQAFENWALAKQWNEIHRAHYDWWMFPVERPSAGYGDKFAVSQKEVQVLKRDRIFMKNYRRGVVLVVQAWGWDLEKEKAIAIADPHASGQQWSGYGVRLAKMSDSLRLFGEWYLHKKLQLFFKYHCLPQQPHVLISDLKWLMTTLG